MQDEKLKWWHVRDRSRHEHWLRKFFGQPCNGELFVKQSINMAGALHADLLIISELLQDLCSRLGRREFTSSASPGQLVMSSQL